MQLGRDLLENGMSSTDRTLSACFQPLSIQRWTSWLCRAPYAEFFPSAVLSFVQAHALIWQTVFLLPNELFKMFFVVSVCCWWIISAFVCLNKCLFHLHFWKTFLKLQSFKLLLLLSLPLRFLWKLLKLLHYSCTHHLLEKSLWALSISL